LGVTATIASSGREYVDIAVRLADDPDFRAGVRGEILAQLDRSSLTDVDAYARHLEAAYDDALARSAQVVAE
jgi:predicted O-linked N-acetylglucosamine transferase (SPINDLY family)